MSFTIKFNCAIVGKLMWYLRNNTLWYVLFKKKNQKKQNNLDYICIMACPKVFVSLLGAICNIKSFIVIYTLHTHRGLYRPMHTSQVMFAYESGLYKSWWRTILHIKGVGRQSQSGAAIVALKTAAVKELALRTQSLHHIHTLPAEETHVAAPNVLRKLFPQGTL